MADETSKGGAGAGIMAALGISSPWLLALPALGGIADLFASHSANKQRQKDILTKAEMTRYAPVTGQNPAQIQPAPQQNLLANFLSSAGRGALAANQLSSSMDYRDMLKNNVNPWGQQTYDKAYRNSF